MKTVKEWVSGLKIPVEKFELWLREAPANESFTFWCLQTGRINETEYLAWARDFYSLPTLNSSYFKQPIQKDLWHSIQNVANWSSSLIPIAQWDGVIYLACVEPSIDVQWSFPVQYLLAAASDLKQFWQSLVTAEERNFVTIPPTPDKQTSTQVAAVNAPATAPITDPVNLASDGAQPPPLSIDEPTGLNLAALKASPSTEAATVAPEGLLVSTPASPALAEISPPELSVVVAIPDSFDANAPQGLATPQAANVSVAAAPETTTDTATGTTVTRLHTQFLSSMNAKFSGAMIIEVNRDNFFPLIWNENFRPTSDRAKKAWNLNSPSAFRIAYRTGQPYLGHVVETPINIEFFKEWGFAALPKYVLVQPVRDSAGQVNHLLLALADEQTRPHQLLSDAEKLAAEFSELFAAQKSAA